MADLYPRRLEETFWGTVISVILLLNDSEETLLKTY